MLQVCTSRIAGRLERTAVSARAWRGASQLDEPVVDTITSTQFREQAGLPSLRRKTLTSAGGGCSFRDQEIIRALKICRCSSGSTRRQHRVATRFVNPNACRPVAQIVAVRLWLLVRSTRAKMASPTTAIYQYGDRLRPTGVHRRSDAVAGAGLATSLRPAPMLPYGPAARAAMLISRTIQVRNALGP